MTMWGSRVRCALRNAARRWLVTREPHTRRGNLASTFAVRNVRVGELEAEVYRMRLGGEAGVGASVYVGDEELMRFDCLGATGHFHINVRQSNWRSDGKVPRIAFIADSMPGQAHEAGVHLRRNLRNAIDSNWHPDVRGVAVTDTSIEELGRLVDVELSALLLGGGTSDTDRARRA